MGFVVLAGKDGEALWEADSYNGGKRPVMQKCECQSRVDTERRRRWLQKIDGLTPTERTIRFAGLNKSGLPAMNDIVNAVNRRRGFITLFGPPGTSKSTILVCAVNEARERNVPSVYSPMSDILDYLRQAYAPDSQMQFDGRWDMLVKAEVLAIDEMDEFSATPWAMEKFMRLVDERWRNLDTRLTLFATNRRPHLLPEKVASRMQDSRGLIIATKGVDMRRVDGR